MFQPVRLSVSSKTVTAVPGSRQILLLSLQNASSIVDRYRLSVTGVPDHWYELDQSSVSLEPGARDHVQLTLTPPDDTGSGAGEYSITIHAVSEDDSKLRATEEILLSIGAAGSMGMEVAPIAAEGREASFAVTFLHTGTRETTLTLAVRDDQDGLRYLLEPAGILSLPPGERRVVRVKAVPKVRETIGEAHPYEIEFRGLPEGSFAADASDPLLTRHATFTYQPRLSMLVVPLWVRRLPGWALALLLLALLLLIFLAGNRVTAMVAGGSPAPTPGPSATAGAPVTATAFQPTLLAADATSTVPSQQFSPTATAVPQPQIGTFGLLVGPTGGVSVAWSVAHANQVTLDGRSVPAQGSRPLTITRSTSMVLTASSGTGTVTQILRVDPPPRSTVTVILPPARPQLPTISQFTVRPDAASGTQTLVWRVLGATSVSLNGKPVDAATSQALPPSASGSYELRASNTLGSVAEQLLLPPPPPSAVTHVVIKQPSINSFTVEHPGDGQPYLLRWNTTDASTVTLNGQQVPPIGSRPLAAPVQSGTYQLVAKSDVGQTEAQVQVQVQSAGA